MAATQVGFLIGFKNKDTGVEKDIWLFPQSVPSVNLDSGSITYTMSGDASALVLGNSAAVGEFASTLLASAGTEVAGAASAASGALGDLWNQFPDPFKSAVNGIADKIASFTYRLESLRLTFKWTTEAGQKKYTVSYEMGVSVETDMSAPNPFQALSLKRIYLKLAG